ncbi:PaaI family thioesterase [Pseudonocardia sp. ICBG1122]|nr:PaaI family thioesterase [Pseudonocardia pini]
MTGAQVTGRAELPRHHAGCFACGDGPGGLRMRFADPGPDSDGRARVTGTVVVADAHEGAPGLVHGGVLAAAMDELFGALQHHLDGHYVTAELTTRYRAPVPLGTTLHLDAVIESVDGRKLRVRGTGRLDAPDGTVAVSATALFLGVTLDHFRRYAPEGTRFRERHAR